jgi:RNA methyltransferase, TrmH family
MQHISKNRYNEYLRLQEKKFRREAKKFVIEGWHLVEEALAAGEQIETVIATEAAVIKAKENGLLGRLEQARIGLCLIGEAGLAKLGDTVTSQGILAVVHERRQTMDNFMERLGDRPSSLIVALERISDPGNLGTIIRTCDWFGADGILIGEGSVELYNQKVIRSTQGSFFHLPIIPGVDLGIALATLKEKEYRILGTVVTDGTSLGSISTPQRGVVVFGGESEGLSQSLQKLADDRVTIPGFGKAESLNVSIACGVILGVMRMRKSPDTLEHG